jgi:hypothetical protein
VPAEITRSVICLGEVGVVFLLLRVTIVAVISGAFDWRFTWRPGKVKLCTL